MKKARTTQHIFETVSEGIFRDLLPRQWVIHDYKPDYGLDYAVEIFDEIPRTTRGRCQVYETLAEMFFVQLKAVRSISLKGITVNNRYNVEKAQLLPELPGTANINVIKFPIETELLHTVQSMGAAQPVLLILISIEERRAFHLCLNDYIDKVLITELPDYILQKTCTLRIPECNEITRHPESIMPLQFYAKRPKLYGAFSKFLYQRDVYELTDALAHIRHFISIVKKYDFWTNTPLWRVVGDTYEEVLRLDSLLRENPPRSVLEDDRDDDPNMLHHKAWALWRMLTNLNNMYEEHCREWHMPTYIGNWSSNRNILGTKQTNEAT